MRFDEIFFNAKTCFASVAVASVVFVGGLILLPLTSTSQQSSAQGVSFSAEAWDRYYDKEFDQAVQLFTKEIEVHPDWSDPYDGLGWALLQKGDFRNAAENFKKALEIYAYYTSSLTGMAEVNAWKYRPFNRAWALYYAGDFDKAIAIFNEILSEKEERLPPNEFWRVHLGAGWSHFAKKDSAAAIQHFTEALKLQKDSIDALKGLGVSYFEKGDLDAALKNLEKSLSIQTYQPEVQSKIGWIYHEKGDFENALKEFEKAKRLNPYLVEPYKGMAWTHHKMNNDQKAKEFFITAISIYPFVADERLKGILQSRKDWNDLYGTIGWSYYTNGYYKNAVEAFQEAVQILGEDAGILRGLGYAHSKLGQHDQAAAFLKKSFDKDPNLVPVGEYVSIPGTIATYWIRSDAQSTLAWTLYYQKRYGDAIKEFKSVIKRHPDWVDARDGLGWAHFMAKDLQKAEADFKEALGIDPSYADALNGLTAINQTKYGKSGLGWSYYYQGNYIGALEQFKYTLKEERSSLSKEKLLLIHSGMGWAHFRLGAFSNAEKEFRSVLEEDSNHVDALVGMGYVMFERKSFSDAKSYLNKALGIDPNHYDALRSLGWTHLETNDYANAIESFKKAIAINGYLVDPYYGMGLAYFKSGNLPEAKSTFSTAIDIYPDYVLTEKFEKILESQSDWIDLYSRLGWSYYYKGVYNKASDMFAKILEKNPASKDGLLGLGSIHFQQGDFKATVQKLEPLLSEMPAEEKGWLKWSHVLSNLGWSYFYLGNYDKAMAHFEDLLAIHKDEDIYADPYSGIGWILLKKGDSKGARVNFMKAVELLPGYISALNGLAEVDRIG